MTEKPVMASEAARQGAVAQPSMLPGCVPGWVGCSPEPATGGIRFSINSSYGRIEVAMDRQQAEQHIRNMQSCLLMNAGGGASAAAQAVDKAAVPS